MLIALRIGAYQLLFMDRIPESAAVNESVKLVKNNRAQFAAGLVNAVLRKVASNGLQLPDESDRLKFMSVKYSVPEQTVKLLRTLIPIRPPARYLKQCLSARRYLSV